MKHILSGIFLVMFLLSAWPAQAETGILKNGAPFEGDVDVSLPREILLITYPGGPGLISAKLQGLSSVVTDILKEGPTRLSGEEFRAKLFLLNGKIDFRETFRAIHVIVTAPPQHLNEVLALAAEAIASPKLSGEYFERSKSKVLANIVNRDDDMRAVTFYFGFRDAFGYHPDVMDGGGSQQSLKNVTLETMKEYYPKLFERKHAFYSSVGPVASDKVHQLLDQVLFGSSGVQRYEKFQFQPLDPDKYKRSEMKVALINRPGATDNQVLFVFPEAIKQDGVEKVNGDVTHDILGGGLSGRLGETLRKKRGLTYHAGSTIARNNPFWVVYTFGGIGQLPGLLSGVPEVIDTFKKEKLKQGEIKESIGKKVTEYKTEMELPKDRLLEKVRFKLYDMNPDFLDQYPKLIGKVDARAVKGFVERRINIKGGYLYLMGDKTKLLPILEKQGIPAAKVQVVEVADIL